VEVRGRPAGTPGATAPGDTRAVRGSGGGIHSLRGRRRCREPADIDGLASPMANIQTGWTAPWRRVSIFPLRKRRWIKAHPMPPDRSYWVVDTLLEQKTRASSVICSSPCQGRHRLEERRAAQRPQISTSAEWTRAASTRRALRAATGFDRIYAISDRGPAPDEFARLQMIGVDAPLQLSPDAGLQDSTRVIPWRCKAVSDCLTGLLPEDDAAFARRPS